MAPSSLKAVVHSLRCLAASQLSDAELLQHFIANGDEAAFATLLRRHGRVVLGVCRRVLGSGPDADDVFQATFVVLARKAGSICKQDSLASWLHGVAYRMATRLRSKRNRRRKREQPAEDRLDQVAEDRSMAADPCRRACLRELSAILDDELQRLPAECRDALVLCLLRGLSNSEAAKRLGWPLGTLKDRLQRGRELLRQRLERKGFSLSAIALSGALIDTAAIVPAKLTSAALGCIHSKALPARVAALAAGAMGAWAGSTVKLAGAGILAVMVAGLAAATVGPAYMPQAPDQPPVKEAPLRPAPPQSSQSRVEQKAPVATDVYGDPLPDGAIARLGTVRFRHAMSVRSLAYAMGGKVLVSAGGGGYGICIWDADTGKPKHQIGNPAFCFDFAVSPDGKTILTGTTALIDVATGKESGRLQARSDVRRFVALSSDGRTAAFATFQEKDVVLWDIETAKEIRTLKGNTGSVNRPAFAPDGKTIAAGADDNTVRIWDVATGKELRHFDVKASSNVTYSPDGKTLLSSTPNIPSNGDVVRLWNAATGKELHALEGTQGAEATFSPDGKMLATVNPLGAVQLWDPETAKVIRRWHVPAQTETLAFAPNGKALATARWSAIQCWDVATGQEIALATGPREAILALRFASDGKSLVSRTRLGSLRNWDLSTYREHVQQFEPSSGFTKENWLPLRSDLSPDGTIVAATGLVLVPERKTDPTIYLFDTRTGKLLRALKGHREEQGFREAVFTMKFTPDGNFLNSIGPDGVRTWNVATGKLHNYLNQLPEAHSWPACAFSPDGKQVAINSGDGKTGLYDIATGKVIHHWDSQAERGSMLTISPDGKFLASTASKGILVWTTGTGKLVASLAEKDGAPWPLAFSYDDQILGVVTERIDEMPNGELQVLFSIRLWELRSKQEIRAIDLGHSGASALAFSPDNRVMAVASRDSSILLWDLTGQPQTKKFDAARLGALWADLAGPASKAHPAGWALALNPQYSLPFLKDKLKPVAATPADQVTKLIAGLESDSFAVRQKAAKALEDLGEAAEAAIRKALKGNAPLETHQRLELLLEKRVPNQLRQLRAIEVLARIGSAEARQVLEALAKSTPNPAVAEAASSAASRLVKLNP